MTYQLENCRVVATDDIESWRRSQGSGQSDKAILSWKISRRWAREVGNEAARNYEKADKDDQRHRGREHRRRRLNPFPRNHRMSTPLSDAVYSQHPGLELRSAARCDNYREAPHQFVVAPTSPPSVPHVHAMSLPFVVQVAVTSPSLSVTAHAPTTRGLLPLARPLVDYQSRGSHTLLLNIPYWNCCASIAYNWNHVHTHGWVPCSLQKPRDNSIQPPRIEIQSPLLLTELAHCVHPLPPSPGLFIAFWRGGSGRIYEMFSFCYTLSVQCDVNDASWTLIPCVTKLPEFLLTMQCHVAPARESKYARISSVVLHLSAG